MRLQERELETVFGTVLVERAGYGQQVAESLHPLDADLVLKRFDLKFLEDFAPLGKKFGKKQISSPLIMTPEHVLSSLDVFPIEFLTIKILHKTIFGEDIFNDLKIKKSDLRHQCERELKAKLIGIRQGYLSSSGSKKLIAGMPKTKGSVQRTGKDQHTLATEETAMEFNIVYKKKKLVYRAYPRIP